MNETKILKMNLLGGMNDYICNELGDEEAWGRWISLVPDACTEEDLEFIAEDDELWTMACELFGRLVKEYEQG